ncbi:MAG: hypothetical protein AMXMBFR83_12740 [Phycisphaerae bacterium]
MPSNVPLGRVRAAAIGAVLVTLAACIGQAIRAQAACGRDFTYARDEAYSHLALARAMASPAPASGQAPPAVAMLADSASPAWTGLLAGLVRLMRASPEGRLARLAPLVINLMTAGLLILLVGHAVRFDVRGPAGMFALLLVVAAVMPLPLLVLTGMEHLAHAFVLLLAVWASVEVIERERLAARRLVSSMVWMALAVGLRYESLAVLAGVALWAWIRRRAGRMVLTVLAGAGVAVGVAAYLAAHGESWLPRPIRDRLLEGVHDGPALLRLVFERSVNNLRLALLPAALVVIAAAMLWSRREQQSSPDAEDRIRVGWLFVFLAAGATHLLVGRVDEGFRYTAYLVPLGVVAMVRAMANRPGAKWAPSAPVGLRHTVMAVFCLLPLVVAGIPLLRAGWTAPSEAQAVHERNRQMAAFLRIYFPRAVVASNEVGVLRYEAVQARVLLSSKGGGETDDASPLADVQLAFAVEPSSTTLRTLRSWREIGGWRSTAGGAGKVTLFASGDAGDVRLALNEFAKRGPAGLEVFLAGGTGERRGAKDPREGSRVEEGRMQNVP